jgi:hypothetical protein
MYGLKQPVYDLIVRIFLNNPDDPGVASRRREQAWLCTIWRADLTSLPPPSMFNVP